MARTPKPIAAEVIEVILRLIASHRGKPCPTRREIVAWTGLPRREVWPFLKSLAEREPPLIELEERLHARAGLRRLRLAANGPAGPSVRRRAARSTRSGGG